MNYIAIDKAYLENRIAELEAKTYDKTDAMQFMASVLDMREKKVLQDILFLHSIEVPEAYNWDEVSTYMTDEEKEEYPNGAIIKSKE